MRFRRYMAYFCYGQYSNNKQLGSFPTKQQKFVDSCTFCGQYKRLKNCAGKVFRCHQGQGCGMKWYHDGRLIGHWNVTILYLRLREYWIIQLCCYFRIGWFFCFILAQGYGRECYLKFWVNCLLEVLNDYLRKGFSNGFIEGGGG